MCVPRACHPEESAILIGGRRTRRGGSAVAMQNWPVAHGKELQRCFAEFTLIPPRRENGLSMARSMVTVTN